MTEQYYWHFCQVDEQGVPRLGHDDNREVKVGEWRAIEGYEGHYEVSMYGQIRSWINSNGKSLRSEPKLLRQSCKNSYMTVCLWRKNQRRQYKVHRLVANAFLGQAPTYYQVNHLDGNKRNNFVSNLEWVTARENLAHAVQVLKVDFGHKGESNHRSLLSDAQVKEVRELARGGMSTKDLAAKFSVSGNYISKIRHGRTRA